MAIKSVAIYLAFKSSGISLSIWTEGDFSSQRFWSKSRVQALKGCFGYCTFLPSMMLATTKPWQCFTVLSFWLCKKFYCQLKWQLTKYVIDVIDFPDTFTNLKESSNLHFSCSISSFFASTNSISWQISFSVVQNRWPGDKVYQLLELCLHSHVKIDFQICSRF